MPRKKLIYTHLYPYHVTARSNNRENFCIPKSEVWSIFRWSFAKTIEKYGGMIHGFVLMDNHYHLIISADPKFDLGRWMCYLQTSVSRKINFHANRINHTFGGVYKGSLIETSSYYQAVFKYVFRNPIEAGLCKNAEDYRFSTLTAPNEIPISDPISGIQSEIPWDQLLFWVNTDFRENEFQAIKKGLQRTKFKPAFGRKY